MAREIEIEREGERKSEIKLPIFSAVSDRNCHFLCSRKNEQKIMRYMNSS